MRPLGALLAILTGSAVALTIGLVLTLVTILFLSAEQARFAPEQGALLKAIGVFGLLSAVCGISLSGELRGRAWRYWAHAAAAVAFALAVYVYWPR